MTSHPNNVARSPAVRLAKMSSAHAILSSKPQQKMLHRLALIIQESSAAPTESTKGKLPVEAAYIVMKKVTESAGAPIMPVGLSTYNKLESLRTDPAVTLLKSQSWKDFFCNQNQQQHQQNSPGVRPMSSQSRNHAAPESSSDAKGPTLLDVILDTLLVRLEGLWSDMRISHKEQAFYRKSLCKIPAQSLDQCKELAKYVDALQQHKQATKIVLLAIQSREKAVKRCYDVLVAVHRKHSRLLSQQRDSVSARPTSASSTPSLSRSMRIEGGGVQAFWKEELLMALDEVRCASLEVIKSIQLWRRELWRPQPFFYKEQNYLLKMQSDMAVLDSETYQRLLAMLPLQQRHLLCVIFSQALLDEVANKGLRTAPCLSLPPFGQSTQPAGHDVIEQGDGLQSLLEQFVDSIEASELEVAARVVMQEESLQQALQTEQLSLMTKGVFIPLLRVKFTEQDAEDREDGSDRDDGR